ncbi:hypothetical protein MNBD_GAMMA23-372 [hydrothermal vent metagenome]|uniref:phosphoribosylglycinamide formyltransferase 1 n=1 Tax=hydrothermal vent metagenome TaxID=652676 RepID=A0A3B1A3R1_9ZZZZ
MSEFRVVVIVSPDHSDLYFANQLIKRLNVTGVIVETQQQNSDNSSTITKALKLIHKPHILFLKIYSLIRERIRKKYAVYNKPENSANFGEQGLKIIPTKNCDVLYTSDVNNINAAENIDWLKKIRPNIIAVCGASIFKEEILKIPTHGVLNLHGGLSHEYRGLFTTDWAIYNEEPEHVGATIHFISPGIDDGDVVYQGRPNVTQDDNPNSLYVKVVKLGVNMMEAAIKEIESGTTHSEPLVEKGKLYLGKMFTPKFRDATWKKISQGVISNYLAHKPSRDKIVLSRMINKYKDSN